MSQCYGCILSVFVQRHKDRVVHCSRKKREIRFYMLFVIGKLSFISFFICLIFIRLISATPGHHQGAWETTDGTDDWATFCGNSLWLEFGCFLGTSLLHLKEMVKLLPGEWYDAEVEDDGIARLLPILVYILLVFLLSHFVFHVQSHCCRQH
jgi:hypothetical protein